MKNVVFVAPYFLDATERFISAASLVSDCRVGLVSCDAADQLGPDVRHRLDAHYQIGNLETREILRGVEAIGREFGSIDRLLGMLEQIQVPLGEIRDHLGIPGLGREAANNFRDKSVMKTVLAQHGLPCARHQLVEHKEEALAFTQQVEFPVVVKPPDGAGAKATFRCESESQLIECLENLRTGPGNGAMLEEFITGEEHSFDSVMINGELVWHSICHYSPGPLEVVREPWIQWCVVIPRQTDGARYESIRQVARPALSALGLQTGLSHMEWFLRPGGDIAISEVGARPPGAQIMTLMSHAHGLDLYRAWAELMIHDKFASPQRHYACGAAYLRGMGHGKVAGVHGLDGIASEFGGLIVDAKIPNQGQMPSGSYEGEGFIIVKHPETRIVELALQAIISRVNVELR